MREIKFRAWDKIKNRILEVRVIDWLNGMVDLPYPYIERDWSNNSNNDEVILMQYTGIRDKNGKEIYEGDIFIHKNNHKFVVEWNEDRFIGLDNKRNGGGYCCYISSCDELGNSAIEVIGNIYENPELMKQGKEWKE